MKWYPSAIAFVKAIRQTPIYRPVIEIGFWNQLKGWSMVDATLDYGADISLIPKTLGDRLVKYPPLTVEEVIDAAGGANAGESFNAKVLIAGREVMVPVVVVPDIPNTLLGRLGVMNRFNVRFTPSGFEIIPSGEKGTGENLVLFSSTTGGAN